MKHNLKNLKVALVTDWLTNLGGGEKVLKAIADVFPDAPIYTTMVNKKKIGDLAKHEIRTSFLQKIPVLNKKHQLLLPLLPMAIESLDLSEFDLILSFSSSVAKSVKKTRENQLHICYIHSPMRYAWEPAFDERFKKIPKFLSPIVDYMLHRLRLWDKETCTRPDLYIANSTTTQSRVQKYYRQDSTVLYPPVEISNFPLSDKKKDYYLGVGRMVPYKKFDLLVETFRQLPNKKLILSGVGSERKHIEQLAQGYPNIEIIGEVSQTELAELYAKAKAFILPQKEDAGIVQLEAIASGTPVIAFKAGGALDIIKERVNGVFFDKQTSESLSQAIEKFEKQEWNQKKIRASILLYDTKTFQKDFVGIVEKSLNKI